MPYKPQITQESPPTIKAVILTAGRLLAEAGCDSPRLEAELILAHVLGRERMWLHSHADDRMDPASLQSFQHLIARRERREPLAYLTGQKAFFGLDFLVTPAVLIPRPETELIIELVATHLQSLAAPANQKSKIQNPAIGTRAKSKITIADIGTGSGCLAVTLAHTLPNVTVQAVDISPEALAVARQNAARHRVTDKITFVQGDLLEPLGQTFDVIVSNPPYVSQAELKATSPEVQSYEPQLALLAGIDGLVAIRRLLPQARTRLNPNGLLLVEIGSSQGHAVTELAKTTFPQATVAIKQDLAGFDRVLMIQA